MGGKSWIQLFTNLDEAVEYKRLLRDGDLQGLGFGERNLPQFRLEFPSDVMVQVTRKGFVRIYFQAGSNLVEVYKKLIQVGVPSVGEGGFWFLCHKQLRANMRLTYDLLLAFIWGTLSLTSLPKFRSIIHKRCIHIAECLPTAASLIAMELVLLQDPTDPKVAVMESILRIIIRAFEEDVATSDILMIPRLLEEIVPA